MAEYKSKITGRIEEWWKQVCKDNNCEYYIHEDYPRCSYCTCPDNCVVTNKHLDELKKKEAAGKSEEKK